ncbi:chemotaxis protein CheW [Devosia insulae DS-56]|uniref:Chemotaxis protein CheW n=1 Tax=Devosia insulae DS-56 TaxID=1116389 RepID=A0A1E5XML6_9HYPH|nr:chemotaxis protein CheW [Devosia insulae]OEO29863.1 chemotaxis protein CheW [Devosia insulae DS-56]
MAEKAQYVTLGVNGELFAAPVDKVQEILDMRPVARLPQAPANLLGMTDVRGEGIPVLDLRLTLGLPEADDTENTRIVVLNVSGSTGPMTVGLRTDRVFEVTVLDAGELEPPPAISGNWRGPAVAGIGRRNGSFVTVLDLDRLLGSVAEAA